MPFTWVVLGDQLDKPAEGLIDGIIRAKPAFAVDVGDVVFQSRLDQFATVKKLVLDPLARAGIRLYPAIGNHDFPVQPHWFEFWEPPADKPYYSLEYGNSRFIILDTNRAFLDECGRSEDLEFAPGSEEYAIQTQSASFQPGSAQYEWLVRELESRSRHVFVFFHEPAFSFGGHESSLAIQRVLCPLFERYRVTAAFSGHAHGYERFLPLRVELSSGAPVAVPDERDGVVYIVTAGGGLPIYDIVPDATHAAIAEAFHFVRVTVHGDTVSCFAMEAKTGEVLDAFELTSRR